MDLPLLVLETRACCFRSNLLRVRPDRRAERKREVHHYPKLFLYLPEREPTRSEPVNVVILFLVHCLTSHNYILGGQGH